jgi:hypothetical protein
MTKTHLPSLAVGFIFGLPYSGLAQTEAPAAPSAAPCYDIKMTAPESPYTPILLNRCTGQTWQLVRVVVNDAKGKQTDQFVYRWYMIEAAAGEAALVAPRAPQIMH